MYRQQQEQLAVEENGRFVSRVFSLPVVTTAYGQLNSIYKRAKDSNKLIRIGLETAETGLNFAVLTAKPLVDKFEKPLHMLDDMACNQLDRLEKTYPVIVKPTDQVLQQTRGLYDTKMKPYVDRIVQISNAGKDKVNSAKEQAVGTMTMVKTYGINKMTMVSEAGNQQLERMMNAAVAVKIIQMADTTLQVADRYVDNYLPPEKDEEPCEMTPDSVLMRKAAALSCKVRYRVYLRVSRRMKEAKELTTERVSNIHLPDNLTQVVRTTQTRIYGFVTEISKSEEQVIKELEDNNKPYGDTQFERTAVATTRHVIHKVRTMLGTLDVLVEPLRSRLVEQASGVGGLPYNAYLFVWNGVHSLLLSLNISTNQPKEEPPKPEENSTNPENESLADDSVADD